MNSIGGVSGVGAPLPPNRIGDDGSFAMGTEKVTDGGLENWATPTDLTDWIESGVLLGTRDITKELVQIHGGATAVKFQATANDGVTDFHIRILNPRNLLVVGQKYIFSLWVYYLARTAPGYLLLAVRDEAGEPQALITLVATDTAYTQYNLVFTATDDFMRLDLVLADETNATVYFDDISVRDVDLIARRYGGELIGAIGMQQIELWDKWRTPQ